MATKEQYLRLIVMDIKTGLSVQQRTFYFQTGFNFVSQPDRQYRLIFKNYGQRTKMVELAISYIEPTSHKLANHDNATGIFTESAQQMKELLQGFEAMTRISEEQAIIGDNLHEQVEKNVNSYYRWAVWEVMLFGMLVIAQIWIIGREMSYNSEFSSIV